jgi:hypothetical protein
VIFYFGHGLLAFALGTWCSHSGVSMND